MNWVPPDIAAVETEHNFVGARRIDILIIDRENSRILGIDVQTSNASTRFGQLDKCVKDLISEYPDSEMAIAFLTPFNRRRAE